LPKPNRILPDANPGRLVKGRSIIRLDSYDGHDYVIQASANLVDWSNLLTNSPEGGVMLLTNSPSSGPGPQFYRSVLSN
jgi:hypothetical protein